VNKLSLLLGLVLGASAVLASPAFSATSEAGKQVLAAEKARTTALEHSDLAALERIMADDVTYIHASGKKETTRKPTSMPSAPVNSTTFPGSRRICKYASREMLR
jgi:hypothetical protein